MNPVLLATVAVALVGPSPAQTEAPVAFDGAALGMSINDWKSLPLPAGVGPDATPACAPVTTAKPIPGRPLAAMTQRVNEQACAYDARFGHDILPHSIQLDARYRATGLRYLFVAGRLSEIDFSASVDAYSDVMAMLDSGFGTPSRTVRDSVRTSVGLFPRVHQTWRTPGGDVDLVDPGPDPVALSVRFTAADRPGDLVAGKATTISHTARLQN
jgi:hypothetical protein